MIHVTVGNALRAIGFSSLGLTFALAITGCSVSASAGPDTGSSCAEDSTVTGCSGGSMGFSCTGNDTPDDSDPSLTCSVGIEGNAGSTLYCCITGFTSSTCAVDPTVTGCDAPSIGFSCAGTDTPTDADPSLNCSVGIPGNANSTLFCCEN
jgi:hypothetical protein